MRKRLHCKEMFVLVRSVPVTLPAHCCICEMAPFMFVFVRIAPKRKLLKN
jgi:hypothetical protein